MRPDPQAVGRVIREAAAAEILPRFEKLAHEHVWEKRKGEVVTVVDEAMEARLSAALLEIVPNAAIVGEEGVHHEPRLAHALKEPGPVWIIDPLDGTANFSKGKPVFAVIVAFVESGVTQAGWILDPLNDRLAWGAKGEGAFLGDRRLRLPQPGDPKQMKGFMAWGLQRYFRNNVPRVLDSLGPVTSRNCAGHEYLDLLDGNRHFACYWGAKPWDHAAGVLLHAEAGGHAATKFGAAYRPEMGQEGLVVAPAEAPWRRINGLVFGKD